MEESQSDAVLTLQTALDAMLMDLRKRYVGNPDQKVLYHYATGDTFLAILQSQRLRASDVVHMNDPAEIAWGNRVLNALVEQVEKWGLHSDGLARQQKVPMIGGATFAFCASEHHDSLPQWRSYGGDGLGYAIGIAADAPLTVVSDRPESPLLAKVIYGEKTQKDIVAWLIDQIESAAGEFAKEVGRASGTPEWVRQGRNLLEVRISEVLRELARIFKNPAFEPEAEWRWIYAPTRPYFAPPATGYRSSRFGLTAYVEMTGPDARVPVREVVLAPRVDEPTVERIVFGLLQQCKFRASSQFYADRPDMVWIRRSAATYRQT